MYTHTYIYACSGCAVRAIGRRACVLVQASLRYNNNDDNNNDIDDTIHDISIIIVYYDMLQYMIA